MQTQTVHSRTQRRTEHAQTRGGHRATKPEKYTDPGGGQADTRTHTPRPRSSPAPGLLPAPAHREEKPAESAGTLTPEPWPTATPLF